MLEDLGLSCGGEVAVGSTGSDVAAHYPVDELTQRVLPLGGAHRAAEVLCGDDVRGVDRPEIRELHPALLEVDRAIAPVRHHHVAALPGDLRVRVHAGRSEHAPDRESLTGGTGRAGAVATDGTADRLGHDCPATSSVPSAVQVGDGDPGPAGKLWVGLGRKWCGAALGDVAASRGVIRR